jgi:transcriptional regulator with XRE-family HTH domain
MAKDDDAPPADFLLAVGRRLAAVRLALGYTQDRLADELFVSRGAIGNYEQGKRLAPPHVMARLAVQFFIPMEFIYRGVRKDLPASVLKGLEENPKALEKLQMPVAYVQPPPVGTAGLAEAPQRPLRRRLPRSTLHEEPAPFVGPKR